MPADWQRCAPVQKPASPTILAKKFPHSDSRLAMLQITKERYLRVQFTELYRMRPEPKRALTNIPGSLAPLHHTNGGFHSRFWLIFLNIFQKQLLF